MIDVSKADLTLFPLTFVELTLALAAVMTAAAASLWSYRSRLYRQLSLRQNSIAERVTGAALVAASADARCLPSFADRLAVLDQPLDDARFTQVSREILALGGTERSYLPTHKKGGTVAYETLCVSAPSVVALYLSPSFQELVSAIVGERVEATPLHDQSSCSVLFYERPGDHIGWHYDHNFYKGRHFTVLIPILNRNSDDTGLSEARLMAKIGGQEKLVETPPNTMVVFEGARVLHKATPIGDGERRVVLSMTFCTNPRNSLWQGAARRIKDTAFFGIRALWT